MLRNTFLHVPGIGKTTERRLWEAGCKNWEDALTGASQFSFGRADRGSVCRHLERSAVALDNGEHQIFAKGLGQQHAWRAYEAFRDSCVYLDIETDGGNSPGSITTIGMYDGRQYRCLVKGEDLENFRDLITQYSMIVTFFGIGFDLPVLQRAYRDVIWDHIHFDICPALRKLGFRGGLKAIEKELGIERSEETAGLNGYDAVLLWRKYRLGRDEAALSRLIAYNREDCVNMAPLAETAFEGLMKATLIPESEAVLA